MLPRQTSILTRRSAVAFGHQSKKATANPTVRVNSGKQGIYSCTYLRSSPLQAASFSAMPAAATAAPSISTNHPYESSNYTNNNSSSGPSGDLFHSSIGPALVGKRAWVRRSFDARSNALGLLTCGGEALAKHASFDPQYDRARHWIHNHPVGPAVLSPVLINGLVGALVEASLPQAVPVSQTLKQVRPLIVGVEVCARIEVASVFASGKEEVDFVTDADAASVDVMDQELYPRKKNGYVVGLKTEVIRVRDGVGIAEGSHNIWIPDYLHM